jgi:putative intracellular protease/amidase
MKFIKDNSLDTQGAFMKTFLSLILCTLAFNNAYAQNKPKFLIVVSSEHELILNNGNTFTTGYYLNELTVPAKALSDAGYELIFANPQGNTPALDQSSNNVKYFGGDEQKYEMYKNFHDSLEGLKHPSTLKDVMAGGLEKFSGIFIPGGHAPMTDLMANADLGNILKYFHNVRKPTAIICHGPCALVSAVQDPISYRAALVAGDFAKAQTFVGDWIYKGYGMTVFSSTEDLLSAAKMGGQVPFFPETSLQTAGATVEVGPQRTSHVRVDRELITGQNPQSDVELSEKLMSILKNSAPSSTCANVISEIVDSRFEPQQ